MIESIYALFLRLSYLIKMWRLLAGFLLLLSTVSATLHEAIIADNPLIYLPLTSTDLPVLNYGVYSAFTSSASITSVPGVEGDGARLGSNLYNVGGYNSMSHTTFTFELWYKPYVGAYGGITANFVSFSGATVFRLVARDDKFTITVNGAAWDVMYTSSPTFGIDRWHHLVVTNNIQAVVVYHDGVVVYTGTGGEPIVGDVQLMKFCEQCIQDLTQIAVYEVVLSADQVLTHYQAGLLAMDPATVFSSTASNEPSATIPPYRLLRLAEDFNNIVDIVQYTESVQTKIAAAAQVELERVVIYDIHSGSVVVNYTIKGDTDNIGYNNLQTAINTGTLGLVVVGQGPSVIDTKVNNDPTMGYVLYGIIAFIVLLIVVCCCCWCCRRKS
jgi:hypothetical protein